MILLIAVPVAKRNRTRNVQNVNKYNIVIVNVNVYIGSPIRNCVPGQYHHKMQPAQMQISQLNRQSKLIRLKLVNNYKI